MTRSAFWKLHETYLMIKGEGQAVIERDAAGYPAELWPIPPHWVADIPRLDFPYYTIRSRDGLQRLVPVADMFIVRQLTPWTPMDADWVTQSRWRTRSRQTSIWRSGPRSSSSTTPRRPY